MAYSSCSFPSSQFGLFRLVAISIGFLLLMASNFGSALECYYEDVPISSAKGHAISVWNKLVYFTQITHQQQQRIGMPANANKIVHCSAEYPNCMTLHCEQFYEDNTVKFCAKFPDGAKTGEEACNFWRQFCDYDPDYYCRYCQTDLCNNETMKL